MTFFSLFLSGKDASIHVMNISISFLLPDCSQKQCCALLAVRSKQTSVHLPES